MNVDLRERPASYLQRLLGHRSTDHPHLAAAAETDPPLSWAQFGIVIPVLAGSPGAGASVLATVVADAAAARGCQVLLVDAVEPLRSGLLLAAAEDGPPTNGPTAGVSIRQAHRGPIHVARLEADGPSSRDVRTTASASWLPPDENRLGVDVTVVDLGWQDWLGDDGLPGGPATWLSTGPPSARPLLAVRHTVPGACAAEVVLEGLARCRRPALAQVAAAVLVGTKKPSAGVLAAAGHHLETLLAGVVCLPADPGVAERGVTDIEMPPRLQQALAPLLDTLGVRRSPTRPEAPQRWPRPSPHLEGALS